MLSISNKNNILDRLTNKKEISPITIYSIKNNSYPKLNLFKNQIEFDHHGPMQKPFSMAKSEIFTYRMIFLGLGLLYLILGAFLYTKNLTWGCSLVFGSCLLVKTLICSLCAISSAYCLGLGVLMRSEREAALRVFHQSKQRLRSFYNRKILDEGTKNSNFLAEDSRKTMALRQHYYESLEKLKEQKSGTLHLIHRIGKSTSYDFQEREELFNQAILELKDKLELIIENFKRAELSILRSTQNS